MGSTSFRRRALLIAAAVVASTLALTGCGGSSSASDNTLRVAFGSNGSDGQKVWDATAAQFKKDNPGWNVEFQVQNDDLYETVGLQNLLTSGNAPDVYFEWAGARLANKVRDGYAADITNLITSSGLESEFPPGAFSTVTIDGKVYMVPFTSDVTNVIWYNKDIFAAQGIEVPTTWAELMDASAKLKAAGITPFAMGNKDLWVAGNWVGHIISRVTGEQLYDEVLSQKKPLNSPEFVKAMGYVQELQKNGYVNPSANTISDNEGYALFFDGKAAMLPIGSWIVGIQQEQAPDFSMGWFNQPAIDGGAGDQSSIMGVTTGYIINAKSTKQDKAAEFLKIAFSPAMVDAWIEAGFTPVANGTATSQPDELTKSMVDLLGSGAPIVAPPDTGYDLKVADALNTATSQVLDGVKTPQEALDEAQAKLEAK